MVLVSSSSGTITMRCFYHTHRRWYRASQEQPSALELTPGGAVRVEGGRFKGREGVIVEVRGGVVRVEMQGEEGPVSADMAAAYVKSA